MGHSADGKWDHQWVVYHSSAWEALVEQGYVTWVIEKIHGVRWAFMVKQVGENDE